MLSRILLIVCGLFYAQAWASPNPPLEQLLDEIWQYELQSNPTRATSIGISRFNHKLPDMSPEALEKRNQQRVAFLQKLNTIKKNELDRQQQISLLVQKRALEDEIDKYNYRAHYMPLTSEYGFHSSLARLVPSTIFTKQQDYQDYLTRLSAFPKYFQQQTFWMKKGIATGITQPKQVMQGFEASIQAFIKQDPSQSQYFSPFKKLDNLTLSTQKQQELKNEAKQIIAQKVIPAYQEFFDFFTQEYLPGAKQDIAIGSIDNGLEYYQNRAEFYTTTSMSIEEIHQVGLTEVKRIRQEMQQVLKELNYQGDLQQFIHFLRTDPQFYATSAEELLKQASYLSKQMDAKLPQLFYTLPRTPYGVAPVPESIAPKYTTGRYIAPTSDDKPGYYWVNTYALDKRPLYALPALTLHEAVPGHHLQVALSRELGQLPPVRRYTYISAFGEGWGLYSEYLGKEVGMYKTPYDEFGRLSYEMWRACRLVVDTGMHSKGWSRQQSIQFMLDNTALSEHNVRTEIDRYISWPAQALSYKIGELKIKALRAQAQQQLGSRFDLRAFHDAILEYGSVPLDILEQNIQQFILQQSTKVD